MTYPEAPEGADRGGGTIPPRRFSILGPSTAVLAAIGSLMIVGIMALINADVFGRFLLGAPVPIVAEIVSVSIVSVIFLQLADCVRTGRMIQSDMWVSRLMQRRPAAALVLEAFHHAVGAVMLAILVWYIYEPVADSFSPNRTVGIYGILTLPLWPFYLAVLVGAALTLIQYVASTLDLALRAVRMRSRAAP